MKPVRCLLPALALSLLSVPALAATTVHTSAASFLALVSPGAYAETFDDLVNPPEGPARFSGGGFAYAASAPNHIYLAGGFLGTSQVDEALTIQFTSGNVHAVGAEFFATDINDDAVSTLVTITLGDGTVESFTPTSFAETFRGFTSDVAITSLVISAPGQARYAGLDNLTVGALAVPEPSAWALMGLGLAGVLALTRRRAA